jgi:integrase
MAKKKPRCVTVQGIEYYPVDLPAGFDGKIKRSKAYCRSLSQVSDIRARIKQWKLNRKYQPDTLGITDNDKRWISYLHNELGNLDQIPVIVEHWKRTGKAITERVTVKESIDSYLEARKTHVKPKTHADYRSKLGQFSDRFSSILLPELSPGECREFLDSIANKTSRRAYYAALNPWLDWCIEKRWLVLNPLQEIKPAKVTNGEPEIYKVDAFKALIKEADANTLAFVALGGLAGLRTAEMLRERESDEVLQWEDVDFKKNLITIRPEVSKTDRKRYVPMCPALISALKPLVRQSGGVLPLSQAAFRRAMKKLFERAKVEDVDNGLRHSYGSYWLAAHGGEQGVGALAVLMGNSEDIARTHYIAVLPSEAGKQWFEVKIPKITRVAPSV